MLAKSGEILYLLPLRAFSSVGEHYLHTVGVVGSSPAPPILVFNELAFILYNYLVKYFLTRSYFLVNCNR